MHIHRVFLKGKILINSFIGKIFNLLMTMFRATHCIGEKKIVSRYVLIIAENLSLKYVSMICTTIGHYYQIVLPYIM